MVKSRSFNFLILSISVLFYFNNYLEPCSAKEANPSKEVKNVIKSAKNTYNRRKCPDYTCNEPEKGDNCTEIDDPTKLSTDEFTFLPEDECCPVYKCTNGGDPYIGLFGGYKAGAENKKRPRPTTPKPNSNETGELCQGIVCKAKPTVGVCTARNATTIAATAVYGAVRICCPLWACAQPDGRTTVHFGMSGPGIKSKSSSKGKNTTGSGEGDNTKEDKKLPSVKNGTCSGIVCLQGQPSSNCRKSTPPHIKSLMKIGKDCCPLWTCTFTVNASLYYFHPGMRLRTKYWNTSSPDDDGGELVADPPPVLRINLTEIVTNITNIVSGNKTLVKNTTLTNSTEDIYKEIALDPNWGVKMHTTTMEESESCDSIKCVAPQMDILCKEVKNPQNKTIFEMLEFESSCCPMYKCPGKNKTYLVVFGMYASEPPRNETYGEAEINFTTMKPNVTKGKVLSTTPAPSSNKTTNLTKTTTPVPVAVTKTPVPSKKPTSMKPKLTTTEGPKTKSVRTTTAPSKKITSMKPKLTTTEGPKTKSVRTTTAPPKTKKGTKPKLTTTTEDPGVLITTPKPNEKIEILIDEPGEVIVADYENVVIVNSTVNKPHCKNTKCFPPPSRSMCSLSVIADCDLRTLLGSALDCCPAYKCWGEGGDEISFGITDGISETVISTPVSDDSEQTICEGVYTSLVTEQPKIKSRKKPQSTEVALRPVLIFDVISQGEMTSRQVRYVKSCKGAVCTPPPGVSIKNCQKLPNGTLPKGMKAKGVSTACCPVWKCVRSHNRISIHYGVRTEKSMVYIPFEYNGPNSAKLPKQLNVKLAEALPVSGKCPDVVCVPPLKNAVCRISPPSAIKLVEGSLRQNKKCCPVWTCRRKDTSYVKLYGRTSPQNYTDTSISSILRLNSETISQNDLRGTKMPKKLTKKPSKKPETRKKIQPHQGQKLTMSQTLDIEETSTSDEEESIEEPEAEQSHRNINQQTIMIQSVSSDGEDETKDDDDEDDSVAGTETDTSSQTRSIPQPQSQLNKDQQSTLNQMQKMQQDQLSQMQQMNMENMRRIQMGHNPAMGAPQMMMNQGGFGQFPNSNGGKMVQRMDLNGMVLINEMPNMGGPAFPTQNMQMRGLTMDQYG